MYTRNKAAEFFVLAWCKNWTVANYMRVVTETEAKGFPFDQEEIDQAAILFPWLPNKLGLYIKGRLVRSHVVDNFPKLSDWLWSRPDDVARLRCAPQIEKLQDKGVVRSGDHPTRRNPDLERVMMTRSLVSASRKTHSRSAWNVCKA